MATRTKQIKIGFWAVDLALTVAAVFFLAQAAQHLLVMPESMPAPLVDSPSAASLGAPAKIEPFGAYENLRNSKLFGALSSSNVALEAAVVEEKLPETTLDLKLLGCVAQDGPDPGFAIIQDSKKRSEDTYTVGDFVAADAKVEEIRDSEVVISRGGRRETLSMSFADDTAPARPNRGFGAAFPPPQRSSGETDQAIRVINENLRYINKAKLMQEAGQNIAALLNQFRSSPNVVDGKPSGLTVDAMGSDPISMQSGLRSGDIVKSINGVRVNSIDEIVEQGNKFSNAPEIRVVVERDSRHRTLVYKIRN